MQMPDEIEQFAQEYEKAFGGAEKIRTGFAMLAKACEIGKKDLETYARHNTAVAKILLELGMEKNIVLAGFVHNLTTLGLPEKEVENEFGQHILELIDSKERLEKALSIKNESLETLRKKLLIVMATNPDIFILQLSEALDKARRLNDLSEQERNEFIRHAKEVYAPMAHKLGIYSISSEINEIAFRKNEPEKYAELERKISSITGRTKNKISETQARLKQELEKANLKATVYGRVKTAYSTSEKMKRKKCPIEKIYDLVALRAITESEKDCYEMLGIVHSLWKPMPGEFDDYIAKPKENGYRSLHTTVFIDDGTPVEIQIRTKEMQNFAEFGVAAHWRYKGNKNDSKYDRKIEWVKQVIEWQKEAGTATKMDIFGKEIFALTPKGEIIELPEGSTVLDFAYAVHSELGDKCQSAMIGGQFVPLGYRIRTGDVVQITTSQKQSPKFSWLSLAKTSKAKQKIKAALHMEAKEEKPIKKPLAQNTVKANDNRVRLAKCCSPVPGDSVIGIRTTKRKISVHRSDCPEALKIPGQKMEVVWAGGGREEYEAEVQVITHERIGILKEILDIFAASKIPVMKTSAKATAQNTTTCDFAIKIRNLQQLEILEKKIYGIKGVAEVRR